MHVTHHFQTVALTALVLLAAALPLGCTSAQDASAGDQADAGDKADASVDARIDRSVDARIDSPADAPADDGSLPWDIGGPDYGQPWDAPHDAATDDATGFDAPHDAGPADAKPEAAWFDCSAIQPLDGAPAGWIPYGFSSACETIVYVPPSRDKLPAPIVWEPCPYDLGESTFTCRSIKMDWKNNELAYPYAIGQVTRGYVQSDGKVVFSFTKLEDKGPDYFSNMTLTAEADGQIRQAFWTGRAPMNGIEPSTVMFLTAIGPGKSAFSVERLGQHHSERSISIGGDDTLLSPPVLEDNLYGNSEHRGVAWAGAAGYFVSGANFWVKGWDGTDLGIAVKGTSVYSMPSWVGDNLLFAFESGDFALYLWNQAHGTVMLRGFPPAEDRGAANPASDGKDLVWVEGQHRNAQGYFKDRWVMTSKFTTDPTKIVPRRLCKWPEHTIGSDMKPAVVGCGYAAFAPVDEDNPTTPLNKGSLLIVRLSDGRWWELRPPGNDSWSFPIALTCTEVFAQFYGSSPTVHYGSSTVRRIPLDSLGPGNPP